MTENGIYEPGCGLDNVLLSWGHDEYLYHVLKDQSTCESLRALIALPSNRRLTSWRPLQCPRKPSR